ARLCEVPVRGNEHVRVYEATLAPAGAGALAGTDGIARAQGAGPVCVFAEVGFAGAAPAAFGESLVRAAERRFHHHAVTLARPSSAMCTLDHTYDLVARHQRPACCVCSED